MKSSNIAFLALCLTAHAHADYRMRDFTIPEAAPDLYEARFALDISHPEMDYLTLPLGAAHVRDLALSGPDSLYGITTSSRPDAQPVVFRFDLERQELAEFVTLDELTLTAQNFAYQVTDGSPYTGTYADGETGHLIQVANPDGTLKLKDLGTIREGEGIYTLVLSADQKHLFGTLYPSNAFFHYTVESGEVQVFDETSLSEELLELGQHHHDREQLLCRALGLDEQGRVYGNAANGQIFRYDPTAGEIHLTEAYLAGSSYRRTVRSWALAENGKLYGGTSIGGRLFELDPETLTVRDLGKPLKEDHLNSLAVSKNIVYGIVGEFPERSRSFAYDIASGSYSGIAGDATGTDTTRFWMLPLNNSSREAGPMSQIVNLKNGSAVIAENDLLPSLLFISLRE